VLRADLFIHIRDGPGKLKAYRLYRVAYRCRCFSNRAFSLWPDGSFVAYIGYRVDNNEQKSMEGRFRAVVEFAPNAILMVNRTGIIEMLNIQAESIFGYAREELMGKSIDILLPERYRSLHIGLLDSFFGQSSPRSMGAGRDLYALHRDGREFPVEIALTPIHSEDGPMVLSTVIDISERKQREERIRIALREKDLLIGEVHHRVKNNLQVIHSLLDLQAMRINDPNAQRMLRDSQNRIKSMALIHQTLYHSKDFEWVDFQYFLRMLLPDLIRAYGLEDGITLHNDVHHVRLPIDIAIPCGLIVNELVANALKHGFSEKREGNIWIALSYVDTDAVSLAVANDGVPIPDELDLDTVSTLGMQLVRLLSEQIGGQIDIQRGNPTRFELRFPLIKW